LCTKCFKEKVILVAGHVNYKNMIDKLKRIYLLQSDTESCYYLLFKVIFEKKLIYLKEASMKPQINIGYGQSIKFIASFLSTNQAHERDE